MTLPELLTTIAVVAVLLLLIAPVAQGVMGARRLTHAGDLVMAEVNFWRQSASVRNIVAELCLIKQVPTYDPTSSPVFCALRTRLRHADGTYEWLNGPVHLPAGIVMDDASPSTLSSILAQGLKENSTAPEPSYEFIAIPIRPSGGVDPIGSLGLKDQWYVTLVQRGDLGKASGDIADFVTIQIQPTNGRATLYRP